MCRCAKHEERERPWTCTLDMFLNGANILKRSSVLPLNTSKYYVMYTLKAFHVLEVLEPDTSRMYIRHYFAPLKVEESTTSDFHRRSRKPFMEQVYPPPSATIVTSYLPDKVACYPAWSTQFGENMSLTPTVPPYILTGTPYSNMRQQKSTNEISRSLTIYSFNPAILNYSCSDTASCTLCAGRGVRSSPFWLRFNPPYELQLETSIDANAPVHPV